MTRTASSPTGLSRTRRIDIRVTEDEYALILRRAGKQALSDYARARLLEPSATPEVVAAVHYLNSSVTGLQDALQQAQAFLLNRENT